MVVEQGQCGPVDEASVLILLAYLLSTRAQLYPASSLAWLRAYQAPLWDFDRLAQTLPDNGMRPDGVHLTYFPSFDYTKPDALSTGYGVHNLSALLMLYEILRLLSLLPNTVYSPS